jgi:hypothetical protein
MSGDGHVYEKCTRSTCKECGGFGEYNGAPCTQCHGVGTTPCSGCSLDSGMDCRYEALSYCSVCGGLEGSLLPVCPGRRLTMDEHDKNYAHYCAGTGPFGKLTLDAAVEARVFAERYVADALCNVCGMPESNEQHLAACPDDCGAHDYRSGARHFYDAVRDLWELVREQANVSLG